MGAIVGVVLGAVLVGLGATMVTNFRAWGTLIIEKAIPKLLRMGEAENDRKVLGAAYLVAGVVFVVVSLVVVIK
jgi:hypothetical protein